MSPLAEEIARFDRIGIDSDVLIYALEPRQPLHALAVEVLDQIVESGLNVVVSVVTLHELSIRPIRLGKARIAHAYRFWLREWAGAPLVPVDEDVARRASVLRAVREIRMGDAFHAATALESGARAFLTNDRRFRGLGALRVFVLEDFA